MSHARSHHLTLPQLVEMTETNASLCLYPICVGCVFEGHETASVHDLKNDLKLMFVKRFLGHGFKLPVIFYTGTFRRSYRLS